MDYSPYTNFPFPDDLSPEDRALKAEFLTLSDEAQLAMLRGCRSYEEFHGRVREVLGPR